MEQLKNENLRKQHEEETFVKHQQLQHTAKMVKLPFLLVNIFAIIALSIFLVLLAFYKFPLLLVDKLPPYYWNSPAGLEIAKKIGVSPEMVTQYTTTKKLPKLDTFAKLCKELDLDANYVLGLKND